jgi:hypothetical protein
MSIFARLHSESTSYNGIKPSSIVHYGGPASLQYLARQRNGDVAALHDGASALLALIDDLERLALGCTTYLIQDLATTTHNNQCKLYAMDNL